MSNFQPLEIVSRGSETEPQVVENNNKNNYGLNWESRLLFKMKQ